MLRDCVVFVVLLLVVCGLSGCDTPKPDEKGDAKKASAIVSPGPVDADAPEEFTTTESGLKYRIRRKSDGKKPNPKSLVTVHYRGWLDDGELFDSSYGTGGVPAQFSLATLIPGWTEGILLIGEGGMIELEIPGKLGYGPTGAPGTIPPDATLHFLVELIKVGEDVKPLPEMEQPGHEGHSHPHPAVESGKVDEDAPEEFTTTKSGLKYRIRRQSTEAKPKATNTVRVHYRGWIDDGTVFDESYKRGQPAEFRLSGVIPGWTEGLQYIGKGGMIELEIPGPLGYPDGQPPHIKPGATLHFLVELLDFK